MVMNQSFRRAREYTSQVVRDPIPYCYMAGIAALLMVDRFVSIGGY